MAAIAKLGVRSPEDFVSPYLAMEAARRTYDSCVKPVNSEEFCEPTEYLKPIPQRIIRPAGLPRKRRTEVAQPPPPPPPQVNGDKLKKTFKVTCSKCGEQGHYYKTCKGAPARPDWEPKRKKPKKQQSNGEANQKTLNEGGGGEVPFEVLLQKARKNKKKMPRRPIVYPDEIHVSQSAPQTQPHTVISPPPSTTPKQPHTVITVTNEFRPKQRIFRPPRPLVNVEGPPSTNPHAAWVETSSAAASRNSIGPFRFMPTPGMDPPKNT
ncbi:hypothetical protein PIB30_063167 [Stylosanthes scabra]|uniref:CCHC-type domain-containing protein n=1 Tax=Stylosanthes scabra TaxID=79078 RepID=A0ABU6YK93_9FABA|nr:hypothetical protein [Stylosanthes scabra]